MHGIITLPMPLPTEKGHTYVILKLFVDNYRNEKGTETRLGILSSPIPVFPRMLSIQFLITKGLLFSDPII